MKRVILALTLLSTAIVGVQPASAQQGYYYAGGGYPGNYPVQQQQQYPVLQKVLIGGALVGLGFLAGRATAPRPNYYPPVVQPYPTNYGGGHHHGYHGPTPAGYRGW